MKLNRFLAITLLLMVATATAFADSITEEEAHDIATQFFNSAQSNSQNSAVTLAATDEDNAYFIFNNANGGGYVLVSGDDQLPQIIGYGLENTWPDDEDMVPEALLDALERYASYVAGVRNGSLTVTASENTVSEIPLPVVGPLIQTEWAQCFPYNKYAPEIIPASRVKEKNKGHYSTGCGAIALSQLINYWRAPIHPLERKTCYKVRNMRDGKDVTDTIDVTLDPATTYNYDNMPLKLEPTAEATTWMTPEEWESKGEDVARLIRDVAYALNMGWVGWSGAGGSDPYGFEQALIQGFDFSLDTYSIMLEGYSQLLNPEVWEQMKDCLDKKIPIVSRAINTTSTSSHVFLFDGYDTRGFVHVNWGWAGACNNWFSPGFLLTNMYDTTEGRKFNFTRNNNVTLYLHPRTEPETYHIDERQLVAHHISFCSSEKAIQDKYIDPSFNAMPEQPTQAVYYLDRSKAVLHEEFAGLSLLKNLGSDYDFTFNLTGDNSNVVKRDTVHFDFNQFDTRWVVADVVARNEFSLSDCEDGSYTLTGSMRQILGTETSSWKEVRHDSRLLVKGKDVMILPHVYENSFHAPDCHHYIQDDNQMLFHLDYKNNPDELKVDSTLILQLNISCIANSAISYVNEGASTDALLIISHNEHNDTVANNTKAMNDFVTKTQTATTKQTVVDIQNKKFTINEAGKYTITYSWPAMNVCLKDEFTVSIPTAIENVETQNPGLSPQNTYNLSGQQVSKNYRGIVICKGKKTVTKQQ